DPLERCKAVELDMLDHLDQGRGIKALDAGIPIGQRPLQELDACALPLTERIQAQPSCRNFEIANADVHTHDLRELLFRHQALEELPIATSKVQHTARTAGP